MLVGNDKRKIQEFEFLINDVLTTIFAGFFAEIFKICKLSRMST